MATENNPFLVAAETHFRGDRPPSFNILWRPDSSSHEAESHSGRLPVRVTHSGVGGGEFPGCKRTVNLKDPGRQRSKSETRGGVAWWLRQLAAARRSPRKRRCRQGTNYRLAGQVTITWTGSLSLCPFVTSSCCSLSWSPPSSSFSCWKLTRNRSLLTNKHLELKNLKKNAVTVFTEGVNKCTHAEDDQQEVFSDRQRRR